MFFFLTVFLNCDHDLLSSNYEIESNDNDLLFIFYFILISNFITLCYYFVVIAVLLSFLFFILLLKSMAAHGTVQSKVVKFGTLVEGPCQEAMAQIDVNWPKWGALANS